MFYRNELLDKPEIHKKKLSVLQKIAATVPVTDNIDVITNHMLALTIEYTQAERGSVMLTNEKGELHVHAARNIDMQRVRNQKTRRGAGIAGTVARKREAVLVTDIESDKSFKGTTGHNYKTKSFISCPIIGKNELLGIININDKIDKKPFTEDELMLVKIIADQSAVALEKAFLINQARSKAAEFEEMNSNLIDCEVSRADFFNQISHRLRTPLHSIKGAAHYLQKGDQLTRGEQKEFLGIISNETGNLISIIERFLDCMKPEDKIEPSRRTLINIRLN